MQAQRELLRFLSDYQEIWHAQFPELHRRGQWHIACHLSTRGSRGAAVAELSSIVKPLFLLDDATVRERIQDMQGLGLCEVDPPDRTLSARSIVTPTTELLRRCDAHLHATAIRLRELAHTIDRTVAVRGEIGLNRTTRLAILDAIERCDEAWLAAIESVFDQLKLSPARRLDARRHLLSVSHRTLLLMALAHAFAGAPTDDEDGLLADDMAAQLLRLARQNFQTTRDHVGQLLQLGLLQRRPGRALRVALAPQVAATFEPALARLAEALPALVEAFRGDDAVEQTLTVNRALPPEAPARILMISHEAEPTREVSLGTEALVVGRAATSDIVLPADMVSRAHCRLSPDPTGVTVEDLQSTNGTFLAGKRLSAPTLLPPGTALRIGPYTLTLRDNAGVDVEATATRGPRARRQ